MRKVAGVLSMTGLLALTACGGGGHASTHSANATTSGSVSPTPSGSSTAPGPVGAVAIADASAEVALAAGDGVLAPAALAAAATQGTKAVATATKAPVPVPTRVIANSASGEFAVAHTNGTFRRPTQIVLKVSASPSQSGSIFWTIVCSEAGGGVGHQQARSTTTLPTTENLPIPAASKYCIASANVQLSKSGTVTITITG